MNPPNIKYNKILNTTKPSEGCCEAQPRFTSQIFFMCQLNGFYSAESSHKFSYEKLQCTSLLPD